MHAYTPTQPPTHLPTPTWIKQNNNKNYKCTWQSTNLTCFHLNQQTSKILWTARGWWGQRLCHQMRQHNFQSVEGKPGWSSIWSPTHTGGAATKQSKKTTSRCAGKLCIHWHCCSWDNTLQSFANGRQAITATGRRKTAALLSLMLMLAHTLSGECVHQDKMKHSQFNHKPVSSTVWQKLQRI